MRASQRDHLWSFQRYAENCRCFYVNVAFGGVPDYLGSVKFDLIIFHWSFVGARVDRDWFKKTLKRIENVKRFSGVRVTMPQDEFVSMDLLCDFIDEFNIETVFSVAPESEWSKIYRTVDTNRTNFIRVLTGYLDERLVRKWGVLAEHKTDRSIDIGYRTVSQAIWGRFNLIKGQIAELFENSPRDHGLRVDIMVGAQHFKMGDDWLMFLSSCRYTLGIEGGSSLLDWDGSLSQAIYSHLRVHPNASFDELERECIPPGKDGEIAVVAISPRHLEACLTRTAQILVEGEYNGILKPDTHFIPLKKDFSNVGEVLSLIKDETRRRDMVERAYSDIVNSGQYTYRSMVRLVLAVVQLHPQDRIETTLNSFADRLRYFLNQVMQSGIFVYVYLYSRARDARNTLQRI
jgi:hypothetical protein